MADSIDLVVATAGGPSLTLLLAALDGPPSHLPARVIVADDRADATAPLPTGMLSPALAARLHVVTSGGRGRAAARNAGWRASRAEWVVFLDDDVVPCRGWVTELGADLAGLPPEVAASRGQVRVPLPPDRAPTEHERALRRVESTRETSSDTAWRTDALRRLDGFDERFLHGRREQADLALRARAADLQIVMGRRAIVHPVWPSSPWASVAAEADHADDALMRRLHGPRWRREAAAPASPIHHHVATTAAGLLALVGAALGASWVAIAGLVAWLAGTAILAWRRIAPGPRTPLEIATIVGTSLVLPPVAIGCRIAGELRAREAAPRPAPVAPPPPAAVPAFVTEAAADEPIELREEDIVPPPAEERRLHATPAS